METMDREKKNLVISRRTGIVAAVVAGLLVLFTLFAAFAAVLWSSGPRGEHGQVFRDQGITTMGGAESHSVGGFSSRFDNDQATTGTVTNVNGDTFTLAGHGSSTQVKTSTSTAYKGGNEVKVNDTVIAVGPTNDGTLQASRIIINP